MDLSPIQDGVDDADNDPSNELQTISKSGNTVTLSDGGGSFTDAVNDGDYSSSNELNTNFYLSGSTLYLRDAGGTRSADLSSLGGGSGLWVAEDRYIYPADDRMYVSIGKPTADAKFAVAADENTPDEMPIFEMTNNLGEPIFSGFNNGVMFHIENTLDGKGVKGGFAVGGYQRTKADGVQEFFRVTNDSVRVLINDKPGKGVKGGFAVGGYQRGKAEQSTHFVVLPSQVTVNGNLEVTGDIVQKSDSRLKDDVSEIDHAVEQLQQLRGVYFQWNQEAKDQFAVGDDRQIGIIAQELESIYPELVSTDDKGYRMIDYSKLTPVLLEAIKEQQERIEKLEQENRRLKELEERVSLLENAE